MESNPDIDKDVEHIPVKSVSRRKIWLGVLVTAISTVAAAVITIAVVLALKGTDSNKITEKPETYATEPFETTGIRRTHHLHHIDFTNENATTTYTPNYSPVNLTRATTSMYPNATRYQLISANSIASRSPPPLVSTKMFIGNTKTPVPITIARLLAPNNSNSNKPTFFTTKIPTKTSVHLIVGRTITQFKTPDTDFIKRTPKPTKTSVHIIAWTKNTKTPIPSTHAYASTSSYSESFTKSTLS